MANHFGQRVWMTRVDLRQIFLGAFGPYKPTCPGRPALLQSAGQRDFSCGLRSRQFCAAFGVSLVDLVLLCAYAQGIASSDSRALAAERRYRAPPSRKMESADASMDGAPCCGSGGDSCDCHCSCNLSSAVLSMARSWQIAAMQVRIILQLATERRCPSL